MNCGDRDGPTDVTEDKPAFGERRRPGRVNYTNRALIAILRRPDNDVCKEDMTAIDYAICGIDDVIAHSLKLHPQLLADRLRSHACVHAEFADAYGDREVTRNELALADRLHAFANAIELDDTIIPVVTTCAVRHSAVQPGCKTCTRSCRRRLSSENMPGMRLRAEATETAAIRTKASRGH